MLYAGLDLSRKRLDFHLLDAEGATVDVGASPPDADALRRLSERVARHGEPVRAAIESMNGARFVHDRLELHGWRWIESWRLSREEERDQIARAIETFERVLGERPLGWNCRSWPSPHTRELLVDEGGFIYDSDGSADDVPYYVPSSGRPFLVVPYSKTYNDSRYLVAPGFSSPRDFLDTLTLGLDELVRDGRTALMTVPVHARWTGQAARAAAVRAFLEHAQTLDGVAFMRRLDIARWWLDSYPP